ncbi:sulfite exporter TauE/SafE family protein [Tsukamurella soli]|uniref:sulfite exporter TauE/SafE family protein n=1 Tax=Tsukamurella soli TaxID=644556 RepID=UPI00361DD781
MSGVATMFVLAGFGLAAGIGITAVGPGGVLATVALFLLGGLSPAGVAGTAIVTHVATGAVGSLAYRRSGQLHNAETRRTARLLAVFAVVGTPIGIAVNQVAPHWLFGVLLAVFAVVVAFLSWFRSRREAEAEHERRHPLGLLLAIGLGVAIAGGMFGVGGPLLTVPLLVAAGSPVLSALAAAQVQSIAIAGIGAVGYAARGDIDWRLALVVGVPELLGAVVGWRIAHAAAPASSVAR